MSWERGRYGRSRTCRNRCCIRTTALCSARAKKQSSACSRRRSISSSSASRRASSSCHFRCIRSAARHRTAARLRACDCSTRTEASARSLRGKQETTHPTSVRNALPHTRSWSNGDRSRCAGRSAGWRVNRRSVPSDESSDVSPGERGTFFIGSWRAAMSVCATRVCAPAARTARSRARRPEPPTLLLRRLWRIATTGVQVSCATIRVL